MQALRAFLLSLVVVSFSFVSSVSTAAVEGLLSRALRLKGDRKYEEASGEVQQALAVEGGLPAAAKAVFLKLEAKILHCESLSFGYNEPAKLAALAVSRFREGKALSPSLSIGDRLDYLHLLRHSARYLDEEDPARGTLSKEADEVALEFVRRGPWNRPDQLPLQYVPGLAARPFPGVKKHFPQLQSVKETLEAASLGLANEYRLSSEAGLLQEESECIHNATTGKRWLFFPVFPEVSQAGGDAVSNKRCDPRTPVACALLEKLQSITEVPILRVGFSVLDPGAHLLPHYGSSNGQLKFHLGLIVPRIAAENGTAAPRPCAFMRVGIVPASRPDPPPPLSRGSYPTAAELPPASSSAAASLARKKRGRKLSPSDRAGDNDGSSVSAASMPTDGGVRSWTEGKAFLFDDSFEHEVVNSCQGERVVLQVVVEHPDLTTKRKKKVMMPVATGKEEL